MSTYPKLEEVVWVQEEPRNMGARAHMSPRLLQILPEHLQFGYVGRPERAASGEGYPVAHATSRTGSSRPRSIWLSRSRSTRASRRASGSGAGGTRVCGRRA